MTRTWGNADSLCQYKRIQPKMSIFGKASKVLTKVTQPLAAEKC
jgi:hypothetical protein